MVHGFSAEFANWFKTDPAFAPLIAGGAPALAIQCEPFAVTYANGAALALFSVHTPAQLTARLETSPDPGARRLRVLAASLKVGAPRLERLRLVLRGGAELVTVLCRQLEDDGQDYLVVATMGLSPSMLREIEAMAMNPVAKSSVVSESVILSESPSIAVQNAATQEVAPANPLDLVPKAPLRFLFQTDSDDRIVQISSEFVESPLKGAASAEGAYLAELPAIAAPALNAALKSRQTWRNVELNWLLANGLAEVPVLLAASPMTNAQKLFSGYRGFGIVHFDRLRLLANEPVEEAHLPSEPVPAPEQVELAPPAATLATEPEQPPQPKQTPQVENPAPDHAAPVSEIGNVVPLHPGKSLSSFGSSASAEIVPLSSTERQAFREIARALGARIDENERAGAKAEAPSPQQKNEPFIETASEPAEPAATPAPIVHAEPPAPHEEPAAAEPSSGPVALTEPVTASEKVHTEETPGPELGHNGALLFDRLPIGILVSRSDVPVYINQTLLDLLGYKDASQFRDEHGMASMFAGPDSHLTPPPADLRALALRTRDGETLIVDAHLQTLVWDHESASLLSIRRAQEADLAPKLKSLELEIRAREAEARELHGILDTATDGVAVLDDTGHILSLNRSSEALLGYEQAEVLGQPFTVLLAPESHAAAMDYLDGLKANGVASVLNDGRDVIGRERHGRAVPLFMTLGRVGQGANAKFCAVLRDVTHWKKAERELKEARAEAERANAQKSDFLAKISHEIRTPLNAILGFTEVISQERFGPVGNERYKDYLKDIHASGMHVMSLVNDLLDLSKIESGKLELTFSSVNANKIVQECVSLMQPQATKDRIIIRVSLAPRLPNIVADERSLRQIVLNILSNAVKFNEPGGQVIVSTALTDAGHAVIRVRDTGIGMNEIDVEHALEPFRQLETSRKTHGTGLGLPLTKAMVEANRASFTIKSKRNEGTLVEVTFPPTRVLAE